MNQINVFIISLDGSPLIKRISEQLNKMRIPFTIIKGIDGRKLSQLEVDGLYDDETCKKRFGRSLTRGEIGCALSHLKVYKKIVLDKLPSAIILEDDAIINPIFAEFYRTWDQIPNEAGLISFYSELGYCKKNPIFTMNKGDTYFVYQAVTRITGTVGYFINQKVAKEIIFSVGDKISFVSDWPISHRKIGLYLLTPFAVSHDGLFSNIEEERRKIDSKKARTKQIFRFLGSLTFILYLFKRDSYHGVIDYYDKEVSFRIKKIWKNKCLSVAKIAEICS